MNPKVAGRLIRQKRIEKGYSQAGLCRGVCVCSYLSKIEQGKAEPEEALLRLLLGRLDISYRDDLKTVAFFTDLLERSYEAVFSLDYKESESCLSLWKQERPRWECSDFVLDGLLFTKALSPQAAVNWEDLMEPRQRALYLSQKGDYAALLRCEPSSFACCTAGEAAYSRGEYSAAGELLRRAYQSAAAEGRPHIMLLSSMLLGNCASNEMDYKRMEEEYLISQRLAKALRDTDALYTLRYNAAATAIEVGEVQKAYRLLKELGELSAMGAHKLAVCCERLGCFTEAREALEAARKAAPGESIGEALTKEMCALVEYRLDNPGYLKEPLYGEMLLKLFARLKKELPLGYAGFHAPYVLQYYKSARQYRQACALLREFPKIVDLDELNG